MRFPEFSLATADGGTLTNADLDGAPWFAYMARHPGCFVCQAKLADALRHRDEVRALGGDVVLFFSAQVDYTRMWTERSRAAGDLPPDLTVAIDPDASLYRAVGTVRGGLLHEVGRTPGMLWRSRAHVRKWRLTRSDMFRMGADVAVGPGGDIALRHVCADPEDRADPATVVAALRAAA